jgi:hypothetical protein
LPKFLFVIGDAVLFDEFDEILRGVAGERGFAEVRIGGEVVLRACIKVGKVATPAAGNLYLFAYTVSPFDDQNLAPAFACLDSAKQPCRAAANDDDIFSIVQRLNLPEKI